MDTPEPCHSGVAGEGGCNDDDDAGVQEVSVDKREHLPMPKDDDDGRVRISYCVFGDVGNIVVVNCGGSFGLSAMKSAMMTIVHRRSTWTRGSTCPYLCLGMTKMQG